MPIRTSKSPKTALVTGAARGIGRAIAGRLLADGWRVALFDSDAEAGGDTLKSLARRHKGSALFIVGDVSSEGDIARGLAEVRKAWRRLDGLVNNAGLITQVEFDAMTPDDWHRTIAVNLTGPFLFSRAAAPLLAKSEGAIVNIASTRAVQSMGDDVPYAASKGGLVGLTHSLAMALGPKVRVNCISPGWINTGDEKLRKIDHAQHPSGRVGKPEDIAALTAYLLGPEAGFVTGANWTADGGMTRKMIYAE